ncbi:thrombospondin type 3 repeat-containing protein [Candidatus Litorirhabdus singularis]|nr:thrombospondin type 3 repeat-containing protein [Candidatus Litorirhabdus singularis]
MSTPSVADLVDRGFGFIYDTDLNITWLYDANYASSELSDTRVSDIISAVVSVDGHALSANDFFKNASSEYTGQMTWWGAKAWVDQLEYSHPQLGIIYDQWRLPLVSISNGSCANFDGSPRADTYGYNCVDSELGSLYYTELGGTSSITTSGIGSSDDQDLSKFINVRESFYHLDNIASPCLNLPGSACNVYFSFYSGFQWGTLKRNMNYVWAALDGDIAAFDVDQDTITDLIDNCPVKSNTDQLNNDLDGQGDACDTDDDNDGLTDATEQIIGTNPLAIDTDNDGFSDYDEVSAASDPLDDASIPITADGDLNNDSIVDARDILLGQQILLGMVQLTADHLAHGDVAPLISGTPSPNGLFNLGDLVVIQRKVMGTISY